MRLRDQNANLGLMKVRAHVDTSGMSVLPEADEEAFCRSPNPEEEPCYIAGDERVNENQGEGNCSWLIIAFRCHTQPVFSRL